MASGPDGLSQPVHEVRMRFDVKVPMRDGVELSTDIYLPATDQPVPVVLIRTPYNNNNEAIVHDCMYFAARGYGVVTQDVRGRWDSDGDWYPFVHEAEDGFDTPGMGGPAAVVQRQRRHRRRLVRGHGTVAGGAAAQPLSEGHGAARRVLGLLSQLGVHRRRLSTRVQSALGRHSDVHAHQPGAVPVAAGGKPPERPALASAVEHHGRQGGPRLAGVAGLDRAPRITTTTGAA